MPKKQYFNQKFSFQNKKVVHYYRIHILITSYKGLLRIHWSSQGFPASFTPVLICFIMILWLTKLNTPACEKKNWEKME